MFSVTLQDDELIAALDEMPATVIAVLTTKVAGLAIKLQALVIDKLSGVLLHVRTGALRRSIQEEVEATDTSVIGTVFSKNQKGMSDGVKYARIQEDGGVTGPHDIYPSKAQALAFVVGGSQVFAKVVHHPGSHIPAHHYMSGSLGEMAAEITEGLRAGVVEGIRQSMGT
jgi:hypothetical protein